MFEDIINCVILENLPVFFFSQKVSKFSGWRKGVMHANVSTGTLHYSSVACNGAQEELSTKDCDAWLRNRSSSRRISTCFDLSLENPLQKLKVA
jgi:hypothetical protein